MDRKSLSIIIPTYNRRDILAKALAALLGQLGPGGGREIIVVDDGSTDGTSEYFKPGRPGAAAGVRYFRQPNRGPAAARNLGISEAAGEVLLFLGDDTLASPGLLDRHAAWHAANPDPAHALLGYVTWAKDLETTPFMEWLEDGGPQFSYGSLADGAEADPSRFFYTSNVSVKRSFVLGRALFDEEFRYAAFEDIELGGRLKTLGLRLYFDRGALAWHDHYTSLGSACARMDKVGESAALFYRKTGRRPAAPQPWPKKALKAVKFSLYGALARLCEKRFRADRVFRYVMDYCLEKGLERAAGKRR